MQMEMPRPGAPQQQLAKLAGTWIGDEQIAPMPWDPQGGPAKGRVVNQVTLDGWVVEQDYEQTRNGKVSFKGHGVFSWDPKAQAVVMTWFDSMAGGPSPFTGRWNGDVLSLTGPSGDGGQGRCTFDVTGGAYKFAMDVSQDGKQWVNFMTGTYAKK
jgi:hypothetical protein